MLDSSIPAILRERASLQPNDSAFTFIDYDAASDGVEETLTWSQLQQKVVALAAEIREHAQIGDRVVILAPQNMSYILGFLASFEANVVAVPLSTPAMGAHDERVAAVVGDARPTVILTTADTAEAVAPYATSQDGAAAPVVLQIDRLDLSVRRRSTSRRETPPATAYLQYTSGSTRTPAGVMVSQRNLLSNFEQQVAALLSDYGKVGPPGTTVVSWLPFYHDMGLILGICAPILGGWHSVVMSPIAFLPRPVVAADGAADTRADGCAQLRPRPRRGAHDRRRPCRARPWRRAGDHLWSRTRPTGFGEAVHVSIRAVQLPRQGHSAILRTRRG